MENTPAVTRAATLYADAEMLPSPRLWTFVQPMDVVYVRQYADAVNAGRTTLDRVRAEPALHEITAKARKRALLFFGLPVVTLVLGAVLGRKLK